MSEKSIMRIVDCYDHGLTYGYLEVENVSINEVQRKIYEIKYAEQFLKDCPDWNINDVFKRFPAEWKWRFISGDSVVEI